MEPKVLNKKLNHIVGVEAKLRKQIIACIREIHRRDLWKLQGFKSIHHYCRETLRYDEFELRSILVAAGIIITESQLLDPSPVVQRRIEALKAWRKAKSIKMNVAPYMIISNQTLMAVAKQNPRTIEMMSQIPGIGEKRLELHGREMLSI